MSRAVGRIKSLECEVTQEQWDELVKAAQEMGVGVYKARARPSVFANTATLYMGLLALKINAWGGCKISFQEFISKLRGVETEAEKKLNCKIIMP